MNTIKIGGVSVDAKYSGATSVRFSVVYFSGLTTSVRLQATPC